MRHTRNIHFAAAAALLLVVALAGCGPVPAPTGAPATPTALEPDDGQPSLAGTSWVLVSLRGEPALDTTEVTLQFEAETAGGSAGCNSYGTAGSDGYTATPEGELVLPQLVSTLMACADDAVMAQEAAYLETLGSVTGYRVAGDTLTLQNGAGETVLTFARRAAGAPGAPPLAGTAWSLASLRGDPPVDGTQITLEFEQEIVTGFAGCNGYGGGANDDPYVATDAGELALPEMARTAMLCTGPEGVMEQEDTYFEALATVDGYAIEGDTLALQRGDETILTFTQRPESVGDPAALAGTGWRLVSLDGVAPGAGELWTLAFHDDGETASGFAGCRAYVAAYRTGSGELSIGGYLAMMGPVCEGQALLEREGAYTTMLGWVDRHELTEDRLELHTVRGETLVFEPLPGTMQPEVEGTEWALLAFVEPSPEGELDRITDRLAGTAVTATFEGGQVRGGACNRVGGDYVLDGASLAVGTLVQTEMFCMSPEGVMDQESRFLGWLGAATAARVRGVLLWVETGDGRALVFAPAGMLPPAGEPAGGEPAAVETKPPDAAPGADARAAAVEALAAYEPVADARPAVEALLRAIEGWLEAGGEPAALAGQLVSPDGAGPLIEAQEADVTGDGAVDFVVRVAETGLPALVFVQDAVGWTGYALPPDYAESVEVGEPVDVDYPWEGGQQQALRLEDLDGDGVTDLVLTYHFAGASSTTAWVSAYRWQEDDFGLVVHADLVSWTSPSVFWLEPDPAGGQRFRLRYPDFLPGRYPKVGVNPRGEQVWRWDEAVGRYVLGWQAAGPARVFWPEALARADAWMDAGEYAAASDAYGAFIGDLDWQKAYLADYGLEGCPAGSDEVGCRELEAWLDLAQLRQGLALALDGEPAAAQSVLSGIEITPDIVALAQAMILSRGEPGGMFGILAAFERRIAAGPGPLEGELDRPAAVYHAYQPSPLLVRAALNWLAPEELPAGLYDLMEQVDAPVEALTMADLDGDGVDEAVWLSPPAWHALAPNETPVGNWQQAWVAWLDGGRWQVTGIAAAEEIELLDITEPDRDGRRAVVLQPADGADAREVALWWDGEMHMPRATEQPDGWPVVGAWQ